MAPRPRNFRNRLLPDGMRERDGYYSWTNPEDGVEYGLGRNKREAISQVMEVTQAKIDPRLIDRINGTESRTWGKWCDKFERIIAERDSKPNTSRTRKSQLKRLRGIFEPQRAAGAIETLDCSAALERIKDEGKARTAQAFRAFLIDCFDRMIAAGWRKDNPARVTDSVRVKVRRARLTLETFLAVYEQTSLQWLRNAMDLALVSGQDRDSCARAQFSDIREGCWWNERSKTGARIILPLELRLDVVGKSLDDVIRQCRSTDIVSRHLVHQTHRAKGARLGKALHVDMITRKFSEAVGTIGANWGEKNPPTFHEIRGLSARLHEAQGQVKPQALLGHRDPRTTSIYTDGRGEWVRVAMK